MKGLAFIPGILLYIIGIGMIVNVFQLDVQVTYANGDPTAVEEVIPAPQNPENENTLDYIFNAIKGFIDLASFRIANAGVIVPLTVDIVLLALIVWMILLLRGVPVTA